MTNEQWLETLAGAARTEGRDTPTEWKIEYDSGDDGCMPEGWYLIGCHKGCPIVFPVRHEYGPFQSREEALLARH